MARALSSQQESLVSIARQEKLRQSTCYRAPEEARRSSGARGLVFFLGTLLFLALAGVGGWYTYHEFVRKTAVPVVEVPQSRLISPESTREISLADASRESVFTAVAQAASGARPTELRHILVRDAAGNEASIETFLTALGAQAPGSLVRAFVPVFMLGSLGEERFLIVKLSSFQNAFAGMLGWEKSMASDLSGLFSRKAALQELGGAAVFTDVAYRNKDLRVISGAEGALLVYSFFNNETLIITESPETLQALVERLTQEALTR